MKNKTKTLCGGLIGCCQLLIKVIGKKYQAVLLYEGTLEQKN